MPADPYAQPAPTGGSRATLTGAAGLYTVMAGFETLVGRDAARCQIVLSEPRVSGVHARLKIEGGSLYVFDEGSNNGTSLGGQRIAPNAWTAVVSGSLLRFGPVEFSVRVE
jgi:pSer/pThr/pTyr-binding forkhead associated (FHA) protein